MKQRKIISKERSKVISGFEKAVGVVASTYGPGGSNVAIERHHNTSLITNDGVSVAKQVFLDDEIEDVGAGFVRDMTYEADQGSGDGTTTTAVLARGILKNTLSEIKKENPVEGISFSGDEPYIKKAREIMKLADPICSELDKMARPIKGKEDLINVATISVESEEYGKIIGEMFNEVGENGYVYVEHDYGFDVKTKMIDGFQLDAGMISVDYSTVGSYTAELSQPNVVITDKEVGINDLNVIVEAIKKSPIYSLVILASGFTEEAQATLHEIFKQSVVRGGKIAPIVPIIMPVTYRELLLRDIAALCGSRFINTEIKNLAFSDLGSPFKKIIIKKNKTYFIGAPNDVSEYVADLEEQKKDMTSADVERMNKRIARLTGSVGIIKVGGETDAERLYWYHKIKDAVNATRLALRDGVVSGGGHALKKVKALDLSCAYDTIKENMGHDFEESEKVIDSVSVVKNSVRKAISAVAQILMTKFVIANKRLSIEEEVSLEMKGMI